MITIQLTEAEFMWVTSRLNAETSEGVFEEMFCLAQVPFDGAGAIYYTNPWLYKKFEILRPLAAKLREAADAHKNRR